MKFVKKSLLFSFFFFATMVAYSQTDKQPGGGWSVEYYVDEFGDKTADTFWRTSPKSGAMVESLFSGLGEGTVIVYVDTSKMSLRFFTKYGDTRGWIIFGDGRDEFKLSIKDTVTGNVIYTGYCYSITQGGGSANADINFRLNNDLLSALQSPNILKFLITDADTGLTRGSFSMTGELPYKR